MIPKIHIEDYHYDLADERIAKYPLQERDKSKLLSYKDGKISEHIFSEITDIIDPESMIIFNETKVVPARLHFVRESGAHIEIFCLNPFEPKEYNLAFATTYKCSWNCVVGNIKRWKDEYIYLYNPNNDETIKLLSLKAKLLGRTEKSAIVEFEWQGDYSFSEVLDMAGSIPIPPYLNRDTEEIDKERYQTLYAHIAGSVAAPTAGLHFSASVLDKLKELNFDIEKLCLHVGAGTFLPVKSSDVSEHIMHREPFVISLDLLEKLRNKNKSLIAVGTTSVRSLESIYYIGVSVIENGDIQDVSQWQAYEREYTYSTNEALDALIDYMKKRQIKELSVGTQIIIVPGFKFRLVDVLVTNFHQPESTLILLVSAFVGGNWREIYNYALEHDFRFLSYGDSSVLFRNSQ